MEPLLRYRFLEAVRASAVAVGLPDFPLFWVENPDDLFHLPWLLDCVPAGQRRSIPLLWDGRPLPALLSVRSEGALLRPLGETGILILREEVLIATLRVPDRWEDSRTLLVAAEFRPDAFEKFVAEYSAFAREQARQAREITVIGADALPCTEGLTWGSICGPAPLRNTLKEEVEGFFAGRDAYARFGIPHRRGLLLTGPPGNGKTTALRVIASVRPEPMILVTRRGRSDQDALDQAFDRAASWAPSLLCFEDLDALFDGDVPLSPFLNRLDGLAGAEGILVLATTNHPEKLEESLTQRPSRFDRILRFENPGPTERRDYLQSHLPGGVPAGLVEQTDGLSYAQLKEVWISACLAAIRRGLPEPELRAAEETALRLAGQREDAGRDWTVTLPAGFARRI